jgi:hypothetical protein
MPEPICTHCAELRALAEELLPYMPGVFREEVAAASPSDQIKWVVDWYRKLVREALEYDYGQANEYAALRAEVAKLQAARDLVKALEAVKAAGI